MKAAYRNKMCHCGSGRKFKKCHEKMTPASLPRSGDHIGVYASYQDIFKGADNSLDLIKKEMNVYAFKQMVYLLIRLNYIFTPLYYDFRDGTLLDYAKILLEPVADRVNFYVYDGSYCLITREQMLTNIQLAFGYCHEDAGKEIPKTDSAHSVQLLFRINDFLELSEEKREPSKNDIHVSLMRSKLINSSTDLNQALARQGYMFNKIGEETNIILNGEPRKLNELFETDFGVKFNDFTLALFGVYAHYHKKTGDERVKLAHKDPLLSNEKLEIPIFGQSYVATYKDALKFASKSFEEFRSLFKNKHKTSISVFYDCPLIYLEDNQGYLMLDENALEWKLSFGAYYMLLTKYKEEFKTEWGKKIFEQYAKELLLSIYNEDEFFYEDEHPELAGADFVIPEGDVIILVEATSKRIPTFQILNLYTDEVITRLKEIFIEHNQSRGKAFQLLDVREKILKQKIELKNVDLDKVKRVVSIVLFEEGFFFGRVGTELCEDILIEAKFKKDFIDDLWFLTIDDFELLMGEVEKGRKIHEVYDEICRSNAKNIPFKNFYLTKQVEEPKPSFVKENFEKYCLKYEKRNN